MDHIQWSIPLEFGCPRLQLMKLKHPQISNRDGIKVCWTSPFFCKDGTVPNFIHAQEMSFVLTEVLNYVFSVSCSKKKCRLQGRHHEVLFRGDGFTCAKPTCPQFWFLLGFRLLYLTNIEEFEKSGNFLEIFICKTRFLSLKKKSEFGGTSPRIGRG